MNIIVWYGGVIYDGETIHSEGLKFAFDQEDIPKENQPILAYQIVSYFLTLKQKQFEKYDKNPQPKKQQSRKRSTHGQDNRFPTEN